MFLKFKVLFRLHFFIITSHELTEIPNNLFISIQPTTVIPFVIFPQKADFLAFFSRGEHDNVQQFVQLIFIDITLFLLSFLDGRRKKFQSKNLIHPSIYDYLL